MKKKLLKKAFRDFEAYVVDNCLVEKTWEDYRAEVVETLDKLTQERECDNYHIFDIVDSKEYDGHIIVADSVFNMYALYVKVLRQSEED